MSKIRNAAYLAGLLANSLGPNVASARVLEATRAACKDPAALSQDDAFEVLELLAKEKGIVGTTARFAKVRLALQWDAG